MLALYVPALENQDINPKTGEIWKLSDVPALWRSKTKKAVEADGYTWDEEGHAVKEVETPKKKK